MQLRPYQQDLVDGIYQSWQNGNKNVLGVLPTGGGKTVIFSKIMHDYAGQSMAIAHRNELVTQISLSLAREQVRHQIIAPDTTIREIVRQHYREVGHSFYDHNGKAAVAGVNTLLSRADKLGEGFFQRFGMWVQDEAHHVLEDNQWGRAASLFPNAYGLGMTATPIRADGKGLGRHSDGLMDEIVQGPPMRWLINNGFLTDYRIFAPPLDLDFDVKISEKTGEYNQHALRAWNHERKNKIVGDVVEHYLKIAPGKMGVTFVVDIDMAKATAAKFRAAGVAAEAISSKTPPKLRADLINRFRAGKIQQLVNVDLFGEGFDLPAIEVVSMARHTMSYALFAQQFGRSLRLMEGKTHAIIIDHVGNVHKHGLPDRERQWSLAPRQKRTQRQKGDDLIPVTTCERCTQVYEKIYKACPYCHHIPIPTSRSLPEHVDGDLLELSPDVLEKLRGEADNAVMSGSEMYEFMKKKNPALAHSYADGQDKKLKAQTDLRDSIAWYAGHLRHDGASDSEIYKRFYWKFGTDIMAAQALKTKDAKQLTERVQDELRNLGG